MRETHIFGKLYYREIRPMRGLSLSNSFLASCEGVESDPHQKMIHMGKSESDRHIRKVIHIQIGKVITIYYLVDFHGTHQTSIRLLQTPK